MKPLSTLIGTIALGGLAVLTLGNAHAKSAAPAQQSFVFEVTLTNLTRNQPMSPLLVASHDSSTAMFELGAPASDELRLLAEDGDNSALAAALMTTRGVGAVVGGAAPIGPGASDTLRITARPGTNLLSLASMLVNTNDAFAGLDSLPLPRHGAERVLIPAYDSGTESNNELCAFIPGPACGSAGVRDTSSAEGFVHVHAGIHGVGDLAPESYDWKNPAALVTIRRVR